MDLITLAMAKAYTDKKAGYSEVKKNILLPMTTLPAGKSAHEAETENDFLVGYEGQVYIVLFDGVKYNCEVGEVTGSVIGVKTDLFMVMAGRGYVDITVTDQTIDHTIEIYQETETIHPIDPKFLPDDTICLADYGTEGGTVNDILLSLALEGGGTVTINGGMEKLWVDALATQPKNLIFDVGAGTDLRMSVCVLFISELAVKTDSATIGANGLLSLYGTNLMGYFVLASTGNGSGLKISVKSDPIEFTTAEA